MATGVKKMPPPPPIAVNDPVFNRWLHELTAFLTESGTIDTGIIPGYEDMTSTVQTHTTQIATNSSNIATNSSNIATNSSNIAANTSAIATNTSNINANTIQINLNTANIDTLFNRAQVRNGTVAPVSALGANGDWYADTVAHHIYVRVSGSWVLIV